MRKRRQYKNTNRNKTLILFFKAEDGIRYGTVTGVQTCALPISSSSFHHSYLARSIIQGRLRGASKCSRSFEIFRMIRDEPIEKRYESVRGTRERARGSALQDGRVCIAGIFRRPKTDRPRIHELIARAYLRGARLCGEAYAGDIQRFCRRVLPVRGDREAHTFAHDLQVRVRNADARKARRLSGGYVRRQKRTAVRYRGDE